MGNKFERILKETENELNFRDLIVTITVDSKIHGIVHLIELPGSNSNHVVGLVPALLLNTKRSQRSFGCD